MAELVVKASIVGGTVNEAGKTADEAGRAAEVLVAISNMNLISVAFRSQRKSGISLVDESVLDQ